MALVGRHDLLLPKMVLHDPDTHSWAGSEI